MSVNTGEEEETSHEGQWREESIISRNSKVKDQWEEQEVYTRDSMPGTGEYGERIEGVRSDRQR